MDDLRHTHDKDEIIRTATTAAMVAPAMTPALDPGVLLKLEDGDEAVLDVLDEVSLVVLEVLVLVVNNFCPNSEAIFTFAKSFAGLVVVAKPL